MRFAACDKHPKHNWDSAESLATNYKRQMCSVCRASLQKAQLLKTFSLNIAYIFIPRKNKKSYT